MFGTLVPMFVFFLRVTVWCFTIRSRRNSRSISSVCGSWSNLQRPAPHRMGNIMEHPTSQVLASWTRKIMKMMKHIETWKTNHGILMNFALTGVCRWLCGYGKSLGRAKSQLSQRAVFWWHWICGSIIWSCLLILSWTAGIIELEISFRKLGQYVFKLNVF
jgi:hypothetical protein